MEFPRISTERLLLSHPDYRDIPRIVELANNDNVSRPTQNMPFPYGPENAVSWLQMANDKFKEGSFIFAIRDRERADFMGGVGLHVNQEAEKATIGYWIGEPFWNYGYVSEALGAIIRFAFDELNLNKLEAVHLLDNPASGRVMVKNGMVQEGVSLADSKRYGQFRDVALFRLLKSEYLAQQ